MAWWAGDSLTMYKGMTFLLNYNNLHRKINIYVPSKEIPSEAPDLFLLATTFSSVETNPSALSMGMKFENS